MDRSNISSTERLLARSKNSVYIDELARLEEMR
jgi:hypothetical protein